MQKEKEIFYRPLSEIFNGRRVAFDIDGVLALTVYPVIERFNEDFGTDYEVNDFFGWETIKSWAQENWSKRLGRVNEVAESPSDYDIWIWTHPEILSKGPVGPNADFMTMCAVSASRDYRVITSRIPTLRESTHEWHKENLPWVQPEKISINKDGNESGENFKYKEILKHGIELHFEDSPRHARLIAENTPATVVLLANWDIPEEKPFDHPQIVQVSRPNHRIVTLRDVHKKLVFDPHFLNVAQS